jgi:hypothetical protein
MNEDALVEFACQLFEGKAVPYWKLQSPQPLKVIEESFKPRTISKQEAASVAATTKDRKVQQWWQERAKKMVANHRTKFADLATVEVATRQDAVLNQRVKDKMKVAKK